MTVVKHTKDILEREIALVDAKLQQPVTLYLIGGGSMSFQDLKQATKDIDGIVESEEDLRVLAAAMRASDYEPSKPLDPEYLDLDATQIYAKEGAPQWDLFVRVVCKKLRLSPGMKARTTHYAGSGENLRLHLVAPEDIFVFKAITERKADIPDVDVLWGFGLDWDAILDEMKWQCGHSDQAWADSFLATLERLAKAGRHVPIIEAVDRLVAEEHDEWAVLYILQEPHSREDIVTELQRRSDEDVQRPVENAIDRLLKRGRILEGAKLQQNPDWVPGQE